MKSKRIHKGDKVRYTSEYRAKFPNTNTGEGIVSHVSREGIVTVSGPQILYSIVPEHLEIVSERSTPSKRIHAVTIKRVLDDDPDTSYLGEYSNRSSPDYAIDRAHSLDCQINNPSTEGLEILSRVMHYLTALTYEPCPFSEDGIWQDVSDAQDLLIEKQDELQECDCDERGDMERGEYRYFNGNVENYKGETPEKIHEYILRDYERMERLQRGDWGYLGIRAVAEIAISNDPHKRTNTSWTVQEITSGGLYGVESDSNKEYLVEIEQEELFGLREQLTALGFSKRAIATAFKNVTRDDQ